MNALTQKPNSYNMPKQLALLGGRPEFNLPLHVGRPNIGNQGAFEKRVSQMLSRRWFTNDGPLVKEFEAEIAKRAEVKHCVSMCNATVALEIAARALGFSGEVILPSYTFVATAHSLHWQGITPVFADIDPNSYTIDPSAIEPLITPRTTGIIGVHVWGNPCDTDAIQEIATRRGLLAMYDAAHAIGCSRKGRMVGGFGSCEVFSFHATKFLNSFEGGAVVTNDDALAKKLRLMRNFGFSGYDNVIYPGTNGKMTEVCAAMGLTSLEAMDEIIAVNLRNYQAYNQKLRDLPGISLFQFDPTQKNNYQYIVLQIEPDLCPLSRDELIKVLHSENVLARKYFWPGCHNMEPYRSFFPQARLVLENTERQAAKVIVLPTGQSVTLDDISRVCSIIESALNQASLLRSSMKEP